MQVQSRLLTVAFMFFLVAAMPGWAHSEDSPPASANATPASEAEQTQHIAARLDRIGPSLLNQISFTMLHCAGAETIDVFMKAVGSPNDHGTDFSFERAVREAGGLANYRSRVATLLTDKNEVVRGYGAQWLGMVGDQSCTKDLLRLLKEKSAEDPDVISGFAREQAASALGLLKARECAPDLAALLQDPNGRVRAGAATGLAIMDAKDHADAIAKLLDDELSPLDHNADRARNAALVALAVLGAKKHAPTIAKQLAGYGDAQELAVYALVALDAKAQAKDLSELLKVGSKRGDAAVALALLNATEYVDPIGELLRINEDKDHDFVRCKAAFAVGALQAKKYTPELVALMKTSKDYNRVAAAWALVMLESQEHASEAITIIEEQKSETCSHLWMPDQGEFVASEQFSVVENRAQKSFAKLKENLEKAAPPKPD